MSAVDGGIFTAGTEPRRGALVLTHGAGSNCRAPLLTIVAEQFAAAGYDVLRFDLPFRVARRVGPPHPAQASADREGIRAAIAEMRSRNSRPVYAGGHSYGGRQASMLLAQEPHVCEGLLLLSYPLHPPGRPAQLRTAHFAELRVPVMFVHGTADPFGSEEEMRAALSNLSARHTLSLISEAGHDLKHGKFDVCESVVRPFINLTSGT